MYFISYVPLPLTVTQMKVLLIRGNLLIYLCSFRLRLIVKPFGHDILRYLSGVYKNLPSSAFSADPNVPVDKCPIVHGQNCSAHQDGS